MPFLGPAKGNILLVLSPFSTCNQCCGAIPGRKYKQGYDGFVELSKEIMKGRNSQQQREAVGGVLDSLMPPEAQKSFRNLFPFSRVKALLKNG